jgi:hypothetical protein
VLEKVLMAEGKQTRLQGFSLVLGISGLTYDNYLYFPVEKIILAMSSIAWE